MADPMRGMGEQEDRGLADLNQRRSTARVMIGVSLAILVYFAWRVTSAGLPWYFFAIGVLYLGLNVWRYFQADRRLKRYREERGIGG